jgi:CHASE2 domain-containing sensor protein
VQHSIWKRIKEEFAAWRGGIVPGTIVLGIVFLARFTGNLQFLEWTTLDYFLRLRPHEKIDERVVVVGINEDDLRSIGSYPIPDREIAALIQKLQVHQPRVIGIDIFRDLPVEPGHSELVKTFKSFNNIIGLEKVLPVQVAPPPDLPHKQVGFSDAIPDADGNLRRALIGTNTTKGYNFYLALRLAKTYLSAENITLENGIRDRQAMRFGTVELPRFGSNFGGYVGEDAGGVQILQNFRSGREPFRTLSLNQIKTGNFSPNWIRDRIVIIGIVSPGVDIAKSEAIASINPVPGQVYGVEIQAHTVSQIISAVLDKRPLLKSWWDGWEYLWLFAWGCLGISLGRLSQSPFKNILSVCLSSLILMSSSYILLIFGWWIPVAPAMLVLVINGIGLTAFYQYDRSLRTRIVERQFIIDSMFDTIHNGPLQTLARLLRSARDRDLPQNELIAELECLNRELRAVYQSVQREAITQDDKICLGNGSEINLQAPIHEILYEVYSHTLERDFPHFKTLKVKIRTFEPIDDRHLSIEQKRGLCRFLEEALCNVGKHAQGVTRLCATCTQKEDWYILCVTDNGTGINSNAEGRGTQQSKNLARQLKGSFVRSSLSPQGTLCELSWTVRK